MRKGREEEKRDKKRIGTDWMTLGEKDGRGKGACGGRERERRGGKRR